MANKRTERGLEWGGPDSVGEIWIDATPVDGALWLCRQDLEDMLASYQWDRTKENESL